ncbi:hypothetical protein SAMN06295926_11592 [Lysinibacillus sp. AC-3]|nr:hypothetical protein SAMN06295926_11592 [Lysinibacillus sp. AC-3]
MRSLKSGISLISLIYTLIQLVFYKDVQHITLKINL